MDSTNPDRYPKSFSIRAIFDRRSSSFLPLETPVIELINHPAPMLAHRR